MNTQKVLNELNRKYPGKTVIQNKDVKGDVVEILCEIDPTTLHPERSTAIAVIDSITPHFHLKSTETYTVLKGSLELYVDFQKIVLKKGESFVINPLSIHSGTGDETWINVESSPGWTFDDHILVGKSLKYQEHLAALVLSGEKYVTWRFWDNKNLSTGDEVTFINKKNLKPFAKAKLTQVYIRTVWSLTKEDKQGHENYDTIEDLLKDYSKYYDRPVDLNTEVKIIHFKLLKIY